MKNNFTGFCLIISGVFFAQNIGIGTNNPTQALDVIGNSVIGTSVYVNQNTYVPNPQGFDVIAIDPQSTSINGKIVKVETLYTPIIIQPYSISNVYRDDITDLNLQIPSDKYVAVITNFEAIPSTSNGLEANNGIYSNTTVKGHFVIRAFESGGTWHVNIGYPTLNPQYNSARYTYNFDIILLSKRFYKVLPESITTYDLGDSYIGDAVTAPSGI